MGAIVFWIVMLVVFLFSARYDLGVMDWLYDKGIYKDKLLGEVREIKRLREEMEAQKKP